jgi:hypothetical protein
MRLQFTNKGEKSSFATMVASGTGRVFGRKQWVNSNRAGEPDYLYVIHFVILISGT